MSALFGMIIRDSFRQFSFNRPAITTQNCEEYLTNKLTSRFESELKNSNYVHRIDKRLISAANLYCSVDSSELEAIFNRKFIALNLDKVDIGNLQKFQHLLDCIKGVKNTGELGCLVSKNISDLIELKSIYVNRDKNNNIDDKSPNIENKIGHTTIEYQQEDEEEGLTAAEFNRIECYLEQNRLLVELKGKESEYFIRVYQEIKENRDKKNEQLIVTNQTSQSLQSGTTELKMELVVDKEIGQNIASVELKQHNKIGTKEAVGSTFWQKLSQKTSQLLATSWSFIKTKLIGFLLPTFFSTKIN
ncbi:MAG: hypothetical protein RAM36_05790 [Arsenophonus sp.]|nr:hypothetical protein [Arsenophonus sp.]